MIMNKVKRLRNETGLTQKEFARSLMVSRQQLSRWEKGEARPSEIYLEKISLIYNVSVSWLVDDDEEEESASGLEMDPDGVRNFLNNRDEIITSRPGLYALLQEALDEKFLIREDEADYLAGTELQGHEKVDYLTELGRYRGRRRLTVMRLNDEEKQIIDSLRQLGEGERREVEEFIEFKMVRKKK